MKIISSYEHKRYPFIAVQFHPETYFNEDHPQDTKRYSRMNIKAGRYFYDLLVDLSKMNYNRFKNEKAAQKASIRNYAPVYAANNTAAQWYVFK